MPGVKSELPPVPVKREWLKGLSPLVAEAMETSGAVAIVDNYPTTGKAA